MAFEQAEMKYADQLKLQAGAGAPNGMDLKFPGPGGSPDYLTPSVASSQYINPISTYATNTQALGSTYPSPTTTQLLNPSIAAAAASAFAEPVFLSGAGQADYLGFPHENGKKRRRQATQAQRRAANIRERKRMLSLNEAFEELRASVPTFSHEKKISRIDTLRLAIIYISFMSDILAGKDENDIQIRSLKHGWTSVREKLQQQMAAQQQAAAEMAAAQHVALNQHLVSNEYCLPAPATALSAPSAFNPATYCAPGGDFYPLEAATMVPY